MVITCREQDGEKVGETMKAFAPFLKMYVEYINNFDTASALISQWSDKSKVFADLLLEIQVCKYCNCNIMQFCGADVYLRLVWTCLNGLFVFVLLATARECQVIATKSHAGSHPTYSTLPAAAAGFVDWTEEDRYSFYKPKLGLQSLALLSLHDRYLYVLDVLVHGVGLCCRVHKALACNVSRP